MHAHANAIVWEVRVFEGEPDADGRTGYDLRAADKIRAVCLARRMSNDDECFISMMFGTFGHVEMTAVLAEAKKWGMRRLWFERAGRLRAVNVK
jgi:hypothetical protein